MEPKQPIPAEETTAPPSYDAPKSSLFPIFPVTNSTSLQTTTASVSQWLCNSSFTTDVSIINDAVVSQLNSEIETVNFPSQQSDDSDENQAQRKPSPPSYAILESSESDGDREKTKKSKRNKKKKRKRDRTSERTGFDGYGSRKSRVRAWADSDANTAKDYYFDSHGDRDNLAFGCIYRMDIARYKQYNPLNVSGVRVRGLYWWNRSGSLGEREADADALDDKMKTSGRYWSGKYMAVERHKSFKHIRLVAPKLSPLTTHDDFIPLSDVGTSHADVDSDSESKVPSLLEESWEDEMLNKTREFNKLTREHPHDEKVWLAFAEFQDRVAGTQRQKGARLQTIEKKISILEKAVELNLENEDLLLCLLKAYQIFSF